MMGRLLGFLVKKALLGFLVLTHRWTLHSLHRSVCKDVSFPGKDGLVTLVASVSSVLRQSVPFGPSRMGRKPSFC